MRGLTRFDGALRAGVADRIQHIPNSSDRLLWRDAGRRILPSDEEARSRAWGSQRFLIQPCSSHSRIAPSSWSIEIAHPRSVRIAGQRSFIISIESLLPETNPSDPSSVPAANTGQGFPNVGAAPFPCSADLCTTAATRPILLLVGRNDLSALSETGVGGPGNNHIHQFSSESSIS
jgi:hypothetical protein